MRILVTNDDGVRSQGLWALAESLKEIGDVSVVAPDRDQSGIGTALTLLNVLRADEIDSPVAGVKATSVQGTPGDCVTLAISELFAEPFDVVVSGINNGSNLGLDVLSSGTVGGALQGHIRHIPSFAISVASLRNVQLEAASIAARALARALATSSGSSPPFLNVNLPNVRPEDIQRVEITRLGPRAYLETVERGNDGRRTHYWVKHNVFAADDPEEGTDIWAVANRRVSITPLRLGLVGEAAGLQELADGVAAELGLR